LKKIYELIKLLFDILITISHFADKKILVGRLTRV